MSDLLRDLKCLVVEVLNLEEVRPEDIGDDTLLFADEGLGLDSIDALALAYPIGIYCALVWFEPRIVAAALIVILLLRRPVYAQRYFRELSWTSRAILAALLALFLGALFENDETLLRLYPALLSGAFLLVFGLSLLNPPSVVERLARLRNPDLTPSGVRYTRQVTQVWCIFFVLNGLIATCTAAWGSRERWADRTGLL